MTVVEMPDLYFKSFGTIIIYNPFTISDDLENDNDPKNEDDIKEEDG